MAAKFRFNLWARIEVYDVENDEHFDLDTEQVEVKLTQSESLEDIVSFINDNSEGDTVDLDEIQAILDEQLEDQ